MYAWNEAVQNYVQFYYPSMDDWDFYSKTHEIANYLNKKVDFLEMESKPNICSFLSSNALLSSHKLNRLQ